ncbi:glyceraldehyde-3-phosphate dehydrogenase [Cricetulus griseus]|uniref:glyceraldehyde-3-phosphate dehydrogenase (phosphorylating) n=1 Tax=Cricetulus griseus TaxID=10029 RepID=A0A061I9D3_CRIGR|nr:glyceraldehyde-3-phosphate dehydrogenase [Cricetulus griseus]
MGEGLSPAPNDMTDFKDSPHRRPHHRWGAERIHSMVQNDFTHGKYYSTVKAEKRKLITKQKAITFLQEGYPDNIKVGNAGAMHFAESISIFTTMEKARSHLKGNPKMIIISASSADAPVFVIGVEH